MKKTLSRMKEMNREAKIGEELSERWYEYDSPLEAYSAQDYAALHAMECELNTHGSDKDR